MWASAALLAVNLPLIPLQGPALTPFLFVNLVALMVTRRRFASLGPPLYSSTDPSSANPVGSRDSTTAASA